MVAAVDGLVVGITLAIMGVPLALPLGVFIFIGGFIPIVGATVAGTSPSLVALVSNGLVQALIVVAVVIGVNQLEHHFLQPVLMGRSSASTAWRYCSSWLPAPYWPALSARCWPCRSPPSRGRS